MTQVINGFTVPAGSDAISTIDDTLVVMAGEIYSRFTRFQTNAQVGTTYTLALADAGDMVTLSNAASIAVTIPLEATVVWPASTTLTLVNLGAGTVTVTCPSGTLNGAATTLLTSEAATLIKTGTNTWLMVKGGGLPKASVSATTGTPTSGANGTKTFYKWTGTGTVTIGQGGTVDVLAVGGGGGGSTAAGGGAGGFNRITTYYLAAGTYTVTVGAGGALSSIGLDSLLGTGTVGTAPNVTGAGGGAGGATMAQTLGGSGGGGSTSGGRGIVGQGRNGGVAAGGGAGGIGSATAGVGLADTLTGATITYGAGGASTGNTAGAANTGNGGGGTTGAAGGSGTVVLLIG